MQKLGSAESTIMFTRRNKKGPEAEATGGTFGMSEAVEDTQWLLQSHSGQQGEKHPGLSLLPVLRYLTSACHWSKPASWTSDTVHPARSAMVDENSRGRVRLDQGKQALGNRDDH